MESEFALRLFFLFIGLCIGTVIGMAYQAMRYAKSARDQSVQTQQDFKTYREEHP